MAELNVQPKKKISLLPWIILLVALLALVWFLTRNREKSTLATHATVDTASTTPSSTTNTSGSNWGDINFSAPSVEYEEMTDKNIDVRGDRNYGIYGLGENVLFDEGKATIRSSAEANLRQVAASINKRYSGGEVRVYGYTDAQGSAGTNKELAQQRADAVKTWLQSNGIDAARISVNSIGEANPVASNNTEQGRQQNRRVEIVARGSEAGK